MAWCLAVWKEKDKDGVYEELKDVMPSHWVEESLRALYWPPYGRKTLSNKMKLSMKPNHDWSAFHLVKVKKRGR